MATKYHPIILVRGFDPLGSSQRDPYTGFNDGTAYTDAVYSSRDFEGFVIAFLKGAGPRSTQFNGLHSYRDTINLIRFHPPKADPSPELGFKFRDSCFSQADPVALAQLKQGAAAASLNLEHPNRKTFWVFNYYAGLQGALWKRLNYAAIPYFARELQRYIAVIKEYTGADKVNLIAHSMGGVLVRHLIARRYFEQVEAERHVNRVVSLGSPLAGISYLNANILEAIRDFLGLDSSELDAMDPNCLRFAALKTADPGPDDIAAYANPKDAYGVVSPFSTADIADPRNIAGQWDPRRWLCVIGTDPDTYAWKMGWLGAVLRGGGGRSDGLVLQDNAYLYGSPRAYLYKCHGGVDSLITSRESYEVAKRFLFGTHDIKVSINEGSRIDNFDPHAYYRVGCQVKVRDVDFSLHQMDPAAKNCIYLNHPENKLYVDRHTGVFTNPLLLYEGSLDLALSKTAGQMAFRFDLGLWAEDVPGFFDVLGRLGLGHSDYAVVQEQFMAVYSTNTNQLLWFHDPKSALKIAGREQKANPLPESSRLEDGTLPVGMLLDQIASDLMSKSNQIHNPQEVAVYEYRSAAKGSGGFDEVAVDTPGFTGSLRIEVVAREE